MMIHQCYGKAKPRMDLHGMQLSNLQSEKLVRLFMTKNIALQFDISQDENSQCELLSIERASGDIFFRISTSSIKNLIELEFLLSSRIRKIFFIKSSLNDGRFHKLIIAIEGNILTIIDNCQQLLNVNDFDLSRLELNAYNMTELRIFIGGKSRNFCGRIREFEANAGPPLKGKCPHLEVILDNPVNAKLLPSSFQSQLITAQTNSFNQTQRKFGAVTTYQIPLAEKMDQLQDQIIHWTTILRKLEDRIRKVELFQRGCKLSGHFLSFGERQQDPITCTECQCSSTGELHCGSIGCPKLDCPHPVHVHGRCCPVCGSQCFYNGQHYESGEEIWPKQCVHCKCDDGRMECKFKRVEHCPLLLDCPEQETPPNQCCPVCVNVDHCGSESNRCDANANCESRRHSAKCSCKPGFFGNGSRCYDIDECLWDENSRKQLDGCQDGSICINLPGSFKCECLPGFEKLDERNCLDVIQV